MNPSSQAALSALRTILAFCAGLAVMHGWLNAQQATELVGAVIVLLPLAWGMIQKFQAETATQARETRAVAAGIAAPLAPGAAADVSPALAKRIIATLGNSQPALALLFAFFLAVSLSACATTNAQVGGIDPARQLADFTIADLQAADMDAAANGDVLAHACYPVLIAFIQSLPSNAGTTVKGAFGAFQKARDLRNVASAGVPLYLTQGCGPLYAQVHGDLLKFLVGAGVGAGAVTNPLLPLLVP